MEAVLDSTLYDACDDFIRRCKEAIRNKDVWAAQRIRNEASALFQGVIPGWYGGLMGQFTGFYLDDVEMILGKLSIFKANRTLPSPRDYIRLTSIVERVMTTHELFENAISEMKSGPCAREPDLEAILVRVREFQEIAESPLSFSERWEQVKPFLHWLTTLEAPVAEQLLPLIIRGVR